LTRWRARRETYDPADASFRSRRWERVWRSLRPSRERPLREKRSREVSQWSTRGEKKRRGDYLHRTSIRDPVTIRLTSPIFSASRASKNLPVKASSRARDCRGRKETASNEVEESRRDGTNEDEHRFQRPLGLAEGIRYLRQGQQPLPEVRVNIDKEQDERKRKKRAHSNRELRVGRANSDICSRNDVETES